MIYSLVFCIMVAIIVRIECSHKNIYLIHSSKDNNIEYVQM
jgi:hypothetical protein